MREILSTAGLRWWVAGGIALDLLLGYETRQHHDVDIAILDRDAESFREALTGWEIAAATGWHGAPQRSLRVLDLWLVCERNRPRQTRFGAGRKTQRSGYSSCYLILPPGSTGTSSGTASFRGVSKVLGRRRFKECLTSHLRSFFSTRRRQPISTRKTLVTF